MIIVSNPKDDPDNWETEYVELGIGNNQFGIHSGLYFDDPYIYFLGYKKDEPNGNYAILARAIFSKLIQNKSSDSIEYFCENEVTSTDFGARSAPRKLFEVFLYSI